MSSGASSASGCQAERKVGGRQVAELGIVQMNVERVGFSMARAIVRTKLGWQVKARQ